MWMPSRSGLPLALNKERPGPQLRRSKDLAGPSNLEVSPKFWGLAHTHVSSKLPSLRRHTTWYSVHGK